MVANRVDPPKPGGAGGSGGGGGGEAAKPEAVASAAKAEAASGGIQAFLPLILALVLMPVLAYVTTTFVLLPKMEKVMQAGGGGGGHGGSEKTPPDKGHSKAAKKMEKTVNVALKKILVNVLNTAGTRYLVVNMTLVGVGEEFGKLVSENQDRLADVLSNILANKTMADLEKPGARNVIRSELITAINTTMGENYVREILFTEWAIQ